MGEYDSHLGVPALSLPHWTSAEQMSLWTLHAQGRAGEEQGHVAFIRTSGRSTFRRCRRKFAWSDIQRGNREKMTNAAPLWFGSGFHFAMEDYHGYRHFDNPYDAFMAYSNAWKRMNGPKSMPDDWQELEKLAEGMLGYYETWVDLKEPLQTFWLNGVPQVEVHFQIPIPLPPELLARYGYTRALYVGTIDRVCIDEHNRLWLLDYKTAKTIRRDHLDLDGQITAYMWGASHIYKDYELAGFIYQQHRKAVPHEPDFLKTTRAFSTSKQQNTTYALYTNALRKTFGADWQIVAPKPNLEFVNWLAEQESDRMDALIIRDFVERNARQIENEGYKILMEAVEILDPNLQIYPNPTRDCGWDCDFRDACLMMDDGSDWQFQIEQSTIDRADEDLRWRNKLQLPERSERLPELHRLPRGRRRLLRV